MFHKGGSALFKPTRKNVGAILWLKYFSAVNIGAMLKMSSMIDIQIPFSRRLKKKPFPTKNKLKVLQPKLEPGFTYLIGPLTTTLPRQHNRNGKKFYYTNTI